MADTTPTLREAAQQAMEALAPLANATTPAEREALTDADAQAADAASCDLRAALAEQEEPVEVTPEMLKAGAAEWLKYGEYEAQFPLAQGFDKLPRHLQVSLSRATHVYRAMRAAAPPAPAADAMPAGWRDVIADVAADISDHPSLAHEKLRRLLASAPAPARQEWQPIETAPRGGNVIVAAPMEAGGYYVEEAWFSEDSDQWWPANVDPTDAHGSPIYPTLWQPLPAAPITAAPATTPTKESTMKSNPPVVPMNYANAVPYDELVTALKNIHHAVAPTHDDDGYHEAAHDLADPIVKRIEAREAYEKSLSAPAEGGA